MLQSSGALVKTPSLTIWQGSTSTWGNQLELGGRFAAYGEIYRRQGVVRAIVDKLSRSTVRLPLKVYERAERGRPEARDHPYAQLLRRPSSRYSASFLWGWVTATWDIYGEAFLGKVRDDLGRPVELVPLHPTCVSVDSDDPLRWCYESSSLRIRNIAPTDVVHFCTYNPDSWLRGVSRLESLRATLENEDASRRATSAFWRNGARPSTVLTHPGNLSTGAHERLRVSWEATHSGVDNFAKTAILEEGMKPEPLQLSAEESQYIESRKLNREEVCIVYDVPPPVLHILDHATYSNITEQMRSMYRDTMAPRLKAFEDELEFQLRSSARPGASGPDFGDEVYAEFLLDDVLRGDFETRVDSYQKGVNSGWLKPSEVREMENLPFADGSDQLFVNSTMVPLIQAGQRALPAAAMHTVMGRLSRQASLEDIDADWLTAGLDVDSEAVRVELIEARAAGESVATFRDRLRVKGVQ